ncbi:unnamed protein product, partial [Porites lobata]
FPGVVGCIDGTHVRIQAPNKNENDYVNRKGFHSINAQGKAITKFSPHVFKQEFPFQALFSLALAFLVAVSMPCAALQGHQRVKFGGSDE